MLHNYVHDLPRNCSVQFSSVQFSSVQFSLIWLQLGEIFRGGDGRRLIDNVVILNEPSRVLILGNFTPSARKNGTSLVVATDGD